MSVKIDKAFVSAYIDADIGLDVAHENSAYNPTSGTEYVELINIPNDITPLSVTGTDQTDGIFRIILYWPVNVGAITPKLKADEILAVFTLGSKVCYSGQCATITRSSRQKGLSVDGWYRIIITITYKSFIGR